ncbi:MAG TPA: M56 family metallopeptidase [Bryobacteraceae bacterium]|nr:M56 family metallopeptidase [Bryobacteraceae bacterium]
MRDFVFIGEGFWPALANHLWQSTVFVALIWVMLLLLRKNQARIRYRLWLAASVKFLVPLEVLSRFGSILSGLRNHWIRPQISIYHMLDVAGRPFPQNALSPVSQTVQAADFTHRLFANAPVILALSWFVGTVTVCIAWYLRWRQVRSIRQSAVAVEEGREIEVLRQLEKRSEIRGSIRLLRSQDLLEPAIFGTVRPVLLWPDRLSEHLKDEHIEAIIAHEIMHVRRHDNVTATIHMFVEALFWFHPFIWWIGKRLVEERERACDEAVVWRRGCPHVYAESLLLACRFCVESSLPCVSGIGGAHLRSRIVGIMSTRSLENLDFKRKLLLVLMGSMAVAGPVVLGLVDTPRIEAQSDSADAAPKVPEFDVASIRLNKSKDSGERFAFTENGFTATNISLTMLIKLAYSVEQDQIIGLPGLIKSQRYDIAAKVLDSDLRKLSTDKRKRMIRPLLTDRFKLQFHQEGKSLPAYVLVIAKNGPKFQRSKADGPGPVPDEHHQLRMMGRGYVVGRGVPIELMVQMMTDQLGRAVVDNTGLKGDFDFTLKWTPDESTKPMPSEPGSGQPPEASDSVGPSFFTAVTDQLGLKLKIQSSPIGVMVIDHVEQPTPN